jgi:hypothetical protein
MKFRIIALSCFVTLSSICLPAFSQVSDMSRFPVLRTNDWRTPDVDVPWSSPVVVKDEFEGNYLAVFDKNYRDNIWTGNKSGIISNWSRKYLRIYSYYSPNCKGLFCNRRTFILETTNVAIKVGTQIFRLEGKDGNFNLTEEVAYALKNAPPGETKIKLLFKGSGREIINDVGKGTVDAWKTVYQDAQRVNAGVPVKASVDSAQNIPTK